MFYVVASLFDASRHDSCVAPLTWLILPVVKSLSQRLSHACLRKKTFTCEMFAEDMGTGCNANTEAVSTPREKLRDKLVLDRRRSPILQREGATRYRSACMRLSYLAQDRLDLAETAQILTQRTGIRLCPVETCSGVSVGETRSSFAISKTRTC